MLYRLNNVHLLTDVIQRSAMFLAIRSYRTLHLFAIWYKLLPLLESVVESAKLSTKVWFGSRLRPRVVGTYFN